MNRVYLGLGSNLGDKIENIKSVVQFFIWDDRFSNVETSSLYITKPYGNIDQENFINGVISFNTAIALENLFNLTKSLEKKIRRTKSELWGPREIDIDILLYGDVVVENDNISIPHIDLLNRDFVIVPLLEINNEIIHPIQKKKVNLFLSLLKDKYIIDKINFNIEDQNSGKYKFA